MYINDYNGKKEMVEALSKVYVKMQYPCINKIELNKYRNKITGETHEFILLQWFNGKFSIASNDMNSLTATASNVARMLYGGVYENIDFYKEIMASEEW